MPTPCARVFGAVSGAYVVSAAYRHAPACRSQLTRCALRRHSTKNAQMEGQAGVKQDMQKASDVLRTACNAG